MIVLPAIDLLDGKCVRLKQGAESTAKIYSENPAQIAQEWQAGGAGIIHVVNLDGAFGRAQKNTLAIKAILQAIDIPIELGGGVRSADDAEKWLDLGVSRVILGTVAVSSPDVVQECIKKFGPAKIVVGIDARGDNVAIEGWEKQTQKSVFELAKQMKDMGVERIIYTDVQCDGELVGPNIERTDRLAKESGLKVIASGGFSEIKHFEDLKAVNNANIEGAIVGTALYEQNLTVNELVRLFEQ